MFFYSVTQISCTVKNNQLYISDLLRKFILLQKKAVASIYWQAFFFAWYFWESWTWQLYGSEFMNYDQEPMTCTTTSGLMRGFDLFLQQHFSFCWGCPFWNEEEYYFKSQKCSLSAFKEGFWIPACISLFYFHSIHFCWTSQYIKNVVS